MNARWRCLIRWRNSGVTQGLSRLFTDDLMTGMYKSKKIQNKWIEIINHVLTTIQMIKVWPVVLLQIIKEQCSPVMWGNTSVCMCDRFGRSERIFRWLKQDSFVIWTTNCRQYERCLIPRGYWCKDYIQYWFSSSSSSSCQLHNAGNSHASDVRFAFVCLEWLQSHVKKTEMTRTHSVKAMLYHQLMKHVSQQLIICKQ